MINLSDLSLGEWCFAPFCWIASSSECLPLREVAWLAASLLHVGHMYSWLARPEGPEASTVSWQPVAEGLRATAM